MKKLSSLNDSFWAYVNPNQHEADAKFLECHTQGGEYEVAGLKFVCPPNIYQPHEFGSTRFVLRGLYSQLESFGPRVLEIGTGSGAIGICLASAGFDVTMVDIDAVAVNCARNNAQRNHLNVTVLQSNLFSAIAEQRFDVIFFNIPLQDKPIELPLEIISCDFGGELFGRFMREAKHYLTETGQILVSIANIGNRQAILKALTEYEERIVYAEFYAQTNAWRWLVSARPLQSTPP